MKVIERGYLSRKKPQWWIGQVVTCSNCGQKAEIDERDAIYPMSDLMSLIISAIKAFISRSTENIPQDISVRCEHCHGRILLSSPRWG